MKRNRTAVVAISVLIMLAGVSLPCAADECLTMNRTVRLYPAPKQYDSYSMYYDITVEAPGLICVGIEIDSIAPDMRAPGKFLSISLRQREDEIEVGYSEFGREGGRFTYGVDAYEFDKTKGQYRIVVSNWSLQHTIAARLITLYPGSEENGTERREIFRKPEFTL